MPLIEQRHHPAVLFQFLLVGFRGIRLNGGIDMTYLDVRGGAQRSGASANKMIGVPVQRILFLPPDEGKRNPVTCNLSMVPVEAMPCDRAEIPPVLKARDDHHQKRECGKANKGRPRSA
jgi:hypothetical protein